MYQISLLKNIPAFLSNMQYSKLSAVVTLAIVTFAAATPTPNGGGTDQCNTGSAQCCQSVQSASTPSVASILATLGIVGQGATVPVGVTCSPLTIIGVSGTSWYAPLHIRKLQAPDIF